MALITVVSQMSGNTDHNVHSSGQIIKKGYDGQSCIDSEEESFVGGTNMSRNRWSYQWWLPLLAIYILAATEGVELCMKRIIPAWAEQTDKNGLRCWDNVKVPSCGGRCDSREVSDWEFPFKISYHPVCVYGSRRKILVHLRHCDPGVEPDTEKFTFLAAEDCRCQICSSQHTSCDWLPPNSTILQGADYEDAINIIKSS